MCSETEYAKVCHYADKVKAKSIIKAILSAIQNADKCRSCQIKNDNTHLRLELEKMQPASNVIPSQPETPDFSELPECDFMTLLVTEKDHILCDDRKVLKAYCKTRHHRLIKKEGHSQCFPKGHIALKPAKPLTRSTRSRNPRTNFSMPESDFVDLLGHRNEDRCL